MSLTNRNSVIKAFAALLLLCTLVSCHDKRDAELSRLWQYVNNNSRYVALVNSHHYEDSDESNHMATLLNHLSMTYDPWGIIYCRLPGINRQYSLLLGDKYYLPMPKASVLAPISDEQALANGLQAEGYSEVEVAGNKRVFISESTDCRTAILDNGVACFLYGHNVDSLLNRVEMLLKESDECPLDRWKTDFLQQESSINFLLSGKFGVTDASFIAMNLSTDHERLTANATLHNAAGQVTTWLPADSVNSINADMLSRMPEESRVIVMLATQVGRPFSRNLVHLLPVPEHATPIYDSIRHVLGDIVENTNGTMALSLSFCGGSQYDPANYAITGAAEIASDEIGPILNHTHNIFTAMGINNELIGDNLTASLDGLGLKVDATADHDILLVNVDADDRDSAPYHKVDLSDKMGYLVVDITPNGPLAQSIGHPIKLQFKVELTNSGLTINAAVNQEAINLINDLLAK